MAMSPAGPGTKNDCAGNASNYLPDSLTDQSLALISTQLTGELNCGSCDLFWDLQVPVRTCQIILE
jgi:hypothetical protein